MPKRKNMTPTQFKEWGSKLGKEWQSPLAKLMPCNIRTIQYWVKGQREIRPMVAQRIKQAIRDEVTRRALKEDFKDVTKAEKILAKKSRIWTQEELEEKCGVKKSPKSKNMKPQKIWVDELAEVSDKAWNKIKRAPVGSLLKKD